MFCEATGCINLIITYTDESRVNSRVAFNSFGSFIWFYDAFTVLVHSHPTVLKE